jgi:prephenate dehydrogenase
MLRRIAIAGLGLIGGSLCLALKRSGPGDAELVGYVRRPEAGERALALGAVDRVEDSLDSAVSGADIVILATPTMSIKDILAQIGPSLPPGCLVTDTASTKVEVMGWAEEYLPATVDFVGGHPMAGKELSGMEAAEADLFVGRTYCLVPGRGASPASVQVATDLVRAIGADPLFITASEHDACVAAVSHLPLVVSSALISATTQSPLWPGMSRLAAGGYRDATRLAAQHPRMNRDICLTNRENILGWIDELLAELGRFRRLIGEGSEAELEQAFLEARQSRQAWQDSNARGD